MRKTLQAGYGLNSAVFRLRRAQILKNVWGIISVSGVERRRRNVRA